MEKEEIESLRLILMLQKEINRLNIENIKLLSEQLKNLSRIVFIVTICYSLSVIMLGLR